MVALLAREADGRGRTAAGGIGARGMIWGVERLIIALILLAVAVAVAYTLNRRRPDPPTQGRQGSIPEQLDRNDFDDTDVPWLLVVFTAPACDACDEMRTKVATVEGDDVAVRIVNRDEHPTLHERYGIDTVPTTVVVDNQGVTRLGILGPPRTGELWDALATLVEEGSTTSDSSG